MSDNSIDTAELKLCTERWPISIATGMYRYLGLESCLLCGRDVCTLCDHCRNNVALVSPSCGVCNGYSKGSTIHTFCVDSRGYYDFAIHLFNYTNIQKVLFKRFKYSLEFMALDVFSIFIKDYFNLDPFLQISYIKAKFNRVVLVPVPSTKKKINERGFYPLREFAILFERQLSRLGISTKIDWDVFKKVKDGESQARKDKRERLLAVQNSYDVNNIALNKLANEVLGEKAAICILDDVYTTGATATVLIEILTAAIPKEVRESLKIGYISYAKA